MQIDKFMQEMIKELDCDELNEMFLKIKSGKKLRSKLVLKISNKEDENSFKLCAIIELIHLASLLHDDVIDESLTRRGKSSINAIYGAKNAIMLGDILYSKAFFELSKFDPYISRAISLAVSRLSIGELMDVKMSENFNTDEEKYLKMIYLKTASLIEASSISGAIIAGYKVEDFKEFGKNLGIAFQIIDDILDITSDEKTLGKPIFNDFKEGKTTLAYMYLYKNLNDNDKAILLSLFKKELNRSQINWLKAKLDEFEIVKKCKDVANDFAKRALNSIKHYNNLDLINLSKSMIDREF